MQTFSNIELDLFKTRLSEREAFKNIIDHSCLLQDLPSCNQREKGANEKAKDIANRLTLELIEKMK